MRMINVLRARAKNRKNVRFGRMALTDTKSVYEGCNFLDAYSKNYSIELGYCSYIGANSNLSYCKIGRFCSIGSNVHIIYGNHPVRNYVSTSPSFYSKNPGTGKSFFVTDFTEITYADDQKHLAVIGNDVFIGSDAHILSGVKIGDGAVIAAGAEVVGDVKPYAIVGGIPAKLIRNRFPDDIIKQLVGIKWWDKDEAWLRKNAEYFKNVDLFLKSSGDEVE